MKKILLFIAALFITTYYSNAQSFSLEWEGEVLGDTITVNPNSGASVDIVFEALFHNKTNDDVYIKVARTQILIVEGTVNYFCWGACYPPHVDTSGMYMIIPGGGYSNVGDFSGHYEINETIGVSLVEYTFYNMDNPDEFVKIIVRFDSTTTGIEDNIFNNVWISDVYPNPATNLVSIDYDITPAVKEASVKIVNILGSVVKEQSIRIGDNKMSLDISELTGGIYFYTLFINGDVYRTKKLIIR